jgi:hypothetical protein
MTDSVAVTLRNDTAVVQNAVVYASDVNTNTVIVSAPGGVLLPPKTSVVTNVTWDPDVVSIDAAQPFIVSISTRGTYDADQSVPTYTETINWNAGSALVKLSTNSAGYIAAWSIFVAVLVVVLILLIVLMALSANRVQDAYVGKSRGVSEGGVRRAEYTM